MLISSKQPQKGFTLIEILVVIAIIAILGTLAVGAALAGLEAARKSSCQNNVRQLVKGINQFVDIKNRYPNAGTYGESKQVLANADPNDPTTWKTPIANVFNGTFGTVQQVNSPSPLQPTDVGPLYNWVVDILGYIDEVDKANKWNLTRVYTDDGRRATDTDDTKSTNLSLSRITIPLLVCPSGSSASVDAPGNLSYVVNGGFSRWVAQPQIGWGFDVSKSKYADTTVGPDWGMPNAVRTGLMFLGSNTYRAPWDASNRRTSVSDGQSFTIMITENLLAGTADDKEYSNQQNTNWACPHPNFCMFIASDAVCQNGNCRTGGLRASNRGQDDGPDWVRANLPGSKTAINEYGDFVANNKKGSFPYPSSKHRNGVVVGMCDGSSRFIGEKIDGTIWSKLITPAGGGLPTDFRQLPLDPAVLDSF